MKVVIAILFALVLINQSNAQESAISSQPQTNDLTQQQALLNQVNHLPTQSFYKSKDRWQDIIDSTWGPGLPFDQKLDIFNTYTQVLTEKFVGFNSLGIDETEWKSITQAYRNSINASTSRGAFAGMMSKISYDLYDLHDCAEDVDVLWYTPLHPGTPVLIVGGQLTVEHFGAVLTVLPDSSVLVLRSMDKHPLDLQPGDIVLGYEGIPWKDLVDELLESGIPILHIQCGTRSASRHNELLSAGMNWHLFDTIDVLKYESGEILHLPVSPLTELAPSVGLIWPPSLNQMWNNEQLPVPGVPFPDPKEVESKALTYGIVDGTNIGYIYLYTEMRKELSDQQFFEAVSALFETDALIIDLRLNQGGGAIFDEAEALLFNQVIRPNGKGTRCNTTDFTLCNSPEENFIMGNPNTLYDRPIAVLLGPNCKGTAESFANFWSYHPMIHYIGKTTGGCASSGEEISSIDGWYFMYSVCDRFLYSDTSNYLCRKEFPIDIPVWFNADDVANGIDPVVAKALEWIHNLSYSHDINIESEDIVPGTDTLAITALVENPNDHELMVTMKIKKDDIYIDSTMFFDDGHHHDSLPGDGLWGALWPLPAGEEVYTFSVSTEDKTNKSSRTLPDVIRYSTLGPVKLVNYAITGDDQDPNPGDSLGIGITLQNNGAIAAAENITVALSSSDEMIKIPNEKIYIGDIPAGHTLTNTEISPFSVQIQGSGNTAAADFAGTGGWQVWTDAGTSINLHEGDQTIRIYAATGGFNLNYVELVYTGIEPDPDPAGTPVPQVVEAEDYADMRGIRVQTCSEGGENVGWIDAGDWMDYKVHVSKSGPYLARFRVAAEGIGSLSVQIAEDCPVNSEISITVDIASNGYTFWKDTFSINILPNTSQKEIE